MRKLSPAGAARGNSEDHWSQCFIFWKPWMSVQNFMSIHLMVHEIFQSGAKWWLITVTYRRHKYITDMVFTITIKFYNNKAHEIHQGPLPRIENFNTVVNLVVFVKSRSNKVSIWQLHLIYSPIQLYWGHHVWYVLSFEAEDTTLQGSWI